MNEPNIYELSHNVTVLDAPEGAALVEFSTDAAKDWKELRPIRKATMKGQDENKGESVDFIAWGDNNDLPMVREMLASENNIVPELLLAKRDLLLGGGMMLYKERWETNEAGEKTRIVDELELTDEMEDFIENENVENFHLKAAAELVKQNNIFAEFIETVGGKVDSIRLVKSKYVRARKQDRVTGKPLIQNWLISDDWLKYRHKEIQQVANYDRKNKNQTKYIKRAADMMFGGPYYYSPAWWGSRLWIKLANCIPQFHLSNMSNGYLIRYHIKFPKDYFVKLPNGRHFESLDDKEKSKVINDTEAAKKEFMRRLNEILVGVKNAGRTIFTTYDVEKMVGKEYPGVKIETIDVDLKDEALLELFDKSNDANVSSQGILPSLSGIKTAGAMSSGSDIRNAYAYYLAVKTPQPRRLLYSFINFVGKRNGWFTGEYKGAKFGSRDIIIATTDKEESGKEEANLN